MHINRGLLFWGLALITAGATALAVQQGLIDSEALDGVWRLWPVVLIAIGLSIILANSPFALIGTLVAAIVLGVAGGALISSGPGSFIGCGGEDPTILDETGEPFDARTAEVELNFNCGSLDVAMTDGSGWNARTGVSGGREVRVNADGTSLRVDSAESGGFNVGGRQLWQIDLGSEVTYDLSVHVNAADARLILAGGSFSAFSLDPNAADLDVDLSGAEVEVLEISMNAGSAHIQTDADTALAGTLHMNAGSLTLCTPTNAALRFTVDANLTFSHNLDERDMTESDDTWTSDEFEGAGRRIDLRLEGNAASFELNPEGGCA